MREKTLFILLLLGSLLVGLNSCRLTKYVPEDKLLLNKTKVKVIDTKDLASANLNNYLQQTQNSEILGFWKLQLQIYNTAPADTTTKSKKRLAQNAHKMGEAPVIYDPTLTQVSIDQLQQAMKNYGYFQATVDTVTQTKKQKINVTYLITANEPYTIRDYKTDFAQTDLKEFASNRFVKIHEGDKFSTSLLDDERQRLSSAMRRHGYYYFDKSFLRYEADSTVAQHEIDLEIKMQDYVDNLPDSLQQRLYHQYYISKVCFHTDSPPSRVPDSISLQTETEPGYEYTYSGKRLLRNRVLRKQCLIEPGDLYNENLVERTYANLNGLGPIKYVDISFEPVGNDSLECHVTISRTKMNNVSAEIEGTYSAGDWGIAGGLGYQNKNIFRGGELLTLNGRGSYEWRQNGGRAIEGKAELGLQFPNSLKINIAYDYQKRPGEYTRTIANAGLYYTVHKPHSQWTHTFNLVDISYVYLPWIDSTFRVNILDKASALKYSYKDHFILDWSYRGSYSGFRQHQPYRSYVNFNYQIETAGNFLYGISKLANLPQDEGGHHLLFNIPFAQYAKADANFTFHHIVKPKHQLVYHAGIGVAVPFLNASTIPFEKRYFAGGSNSVRGWQARTLGPGAFRNSAENGLIYDLQAGDIRLDLNVEYRWKVISFLELAAFVDAGNIWTIRDYEEQPYGVFRWDEFYKQIALAYGVGIRFDFSVLIFRVDFGVKLHDPSRIYGKLAGTEWRTAKNGLCWNDDMTFHFAIGYPF
ncbi:MAG: BamA/TamA family outer membrane protein [Paludibacteraceae bacterium]|nr:BamA/TamA family outer membrane protein [Paludibacteraceae bacterium]